MVLITIVTGAYKPTYNWMEDVRRCFGGHMAPQFFIGRILSPSTIFSVLKLSHDSLLIPDAELWGFTNPTQGIRRSFSEARWDPGWVLSFWTSFLDPARHPYHLCLLCILAWGRSKIWGLNVFDKPKRWICTIKSEQNHSRSKRLRSFRGLWFMHSSTFINSQWKTMKVLVVER